MSEAALRSHLEPTEFRSSRGARAWRCNPWARSDVRGQGSTGTVVWSFAMNNIIYLVGLVVVVIAILSFFGLR